MKHLTGVLTATLAVLAATMSMANWRHDTGASLGVFYAGAYSEPAAVGLRCVGQMPGQTLGATDTSFSPPFGFLVEFGPNLVPPPGTTDRRNDLAIWVGNKGFQLPQMIWNDLDGVWVAPVLMTDQLVTAMRQGGRLVAGPVSGGQFEIPAGNMGVAIEQAMRFCAPYFAQGGNQIPPSLMAFATGTPLSPEEKGGDTLEDYAKFHIAQGCDNAGFSTEPGYIQPGLIDADQEMDYVVDWGRITCQGGFPRPFCGASNCSADLFLSQSFFPEGRPDSYLALGVSLIDLSNGRKGMQLGGSLATCAAAGKGQNGCQIIWYWDGSQMQQIP